ncbi:hypothetical protein I3843_Q021500 [Carya illinoinensis]|nr:hypothetical protein I3843_Q021500 [Carya illinoinensis]
MRRSSDRQDVDREILQPNGPRIPWGPASTGEEPGAPATGTTRHHHDETRRGIDLLRRVHVYRLQGLRLSDPLLPTHLPPPRCCSFSGFAAAFVAAAKPSPEELEN